MEERETRLSTQPPQRAGPVFWRRWWRDILGVLGVVGIVLLLGYRLPGPTTSVPGAVLQVFPPWNMLMPPTSYHDLRSDIILQTYPHRKFFNDEVQAGQFPLWNPYMLTGFPLTADPQMMLFYPATIALGWLSPGNALDTQILIHLLIAGLGMFVLIRSWRGSQIAALAAVMAFVASSPLTVWQPHPNTFSSAAWLPWLIAGYELARRRRLLGIAAAGLVLGLIFLANWLQYAVYDLLFITCYALFLTGMELRQRGVRWAALRPLVNLAAIGVIGGAIGAVQLLPVVELIQLSTRNQPYSFDSLRALALPLAKAITVVAPNFFGTAAVKDSYWGVSNYAETTVYWGVVPFLLALIAPLWRRDHYVWFMWGFWLLACSILLGAPTVYLFSILPGINGLATVRFTYIVCFSGAVLCGLALSHVRASRRTIPAFVIALVSLAVLRIVVHLELLHFLPQLPDVVEPTTTSVRWLTILTLLGAGALLLAWLPWRRATLLAQCALLAVIVLDLVHWSLPYNATNVDEASLFPMPSIFHHIPASVAPPRIGVINHHDGLLAPNSLMVLGYSDIGGYNSLIPKAYRHFIEKATPHLTDYDWDNPNTVVLNSFESPLIDLLSAEYLVSRVPLKAPDQQLEQLATGEKTYLYRNKQAAPRAFIVATTRAVPDDDAALALLAAPDFTPCAFATVEEPAATAAPAATATGCIGTALIVEYSANTVAIRVDTPAAGLLILSDMYYPGWQATIDGQAAPILKTNTIQRGVRVAAGQHEVRFSFRPPLVIYGGLLSLVALLCTLGLLVWGLRDMRRRTVAQVG